MIFDVALITKEAEGDFHIWHLDTERFIQKDSSYLLKVEQKASDSLTNQKWFSWSPRDSKTTQEIQKQPKDPPCLPFLQEHIKVQAGSPLQRNHYSPQVCFWDRNYGNRGLPQHCWQSEQKFPTLGTYWGERLAFISSGPNSLKKEPNVQISWLESCLKFVQ